jgi:hypothetical protein
MTFHQQIERARKMTKMYIVGRIFISRKITLSKEGQKFDKIYVGNHNVILYVSFQ